MPVRSIVVIGAGDLGGAVARQLAAADIASNIVLVDDAGRVAEGKALDILQAAPVDGYSTHLSGSTDESAVVAADVVVIADRAATGQEWQDDAGVALVRRVHHLNPSALVVCAGARQMDIVERGVRETGISRQRLVGTAPEALRAAIISLTALEAQCSPAEISLTVVGRPPAQMIVPWGDASIGGRRAVDVLPPPALTRLDARLSRVWPPGPMTLGSAVARVLRAAVTRSQLSLTLFVMAPREEGGAGSAGMLPVTMQPRGIGTMLVPTLTGRDRVRLETALQS
jgi:malate dehydrogenase